MKVVRTILACTVLLPVWLLMGVALFMFPCCMFMMIFPIIAPFMLIVKNWRSEIYDFWMAATAPIYAPYLAARSYIETGEINFQ